MNLIISDDPNAPMSELSLQQLGAAIKRIMFADEVINYTVSNYFSLQLF